MFTAYVFRHGKSELNQRKRLQGHLDSPLIPEGIENAHSVAKKLADVNFDGIYCSDLGRAFMTAYIVAQDLGYARPITIANKLREVSFGDLAGDSVADAEERYPDLQRKTDFTPPGGESLGTMQKRVVDYVVDLAIKHPSQTVFIATHDCVINALYADYANIDLGSYNGDHYNAHDFVVRLEIEGGEITSFEEHTSSSDPGIKT